MSSSTLHRSLYLRSQTSLGYIATRLERHQGHSARSPATHFDEFVYSAQVTLPEESVQLRQISPLSLTAHIDEINHSTQATYPRNQSDSSKSAHGAQSLTLTSSSTQYRPRSLRGSSTQAIQLVNPPVQLAATQLRMCYSRAK